MALRQWMVPHEWMVKYTPQTEWIERRGILVWIAEVFTSLGAGLYLVSLLYSAIENNSTPGQWTISLLGMILAWIIIMFLKVPLHLLYFGKPLRFWRTVPPFTSAWKTSWFTRGITFTILFGGIAFIQIVITYFFPGGALDIVFKIFGGIFAFLVGIYSGFIMSYCRSVPFWNTALVPLILLFAGIADGFALIMAVGLAGGLAGVQIDMTVVELGTQMLLVVNIILMGVYLWNATYVSKTAKHSAMLLLKDNLALPFWLGVVAFGMIIPLAISVSSNFVVEASAVLLIAAIVLHTTGAVALKYVLLRAGIHNPILPATTSSYH